MPLASDLPAGHQPGRFEDPEVLHDAEAGHRRKRPVKLEERLAIALEEPVEERPATLVRQRLEDPVIHARNNR